MIDQEPKRILPGLRSKIQEMIAIFYPYGQDDGFGDERDSPDPNMAAQAWKRFRAGTPPEQNTDPAPLTEEPPPSI